MKKLFFLSALVIISLSVSAQKIINDPNAEVRQVSSFEGVSVSSGIDLYISYGNEAVAVSASKAEHRERIRTEVENGVLKIWYDYKSGLNLSFNSDRKMKAYVSYKTLKSLSGSGGSDIYVDGTINSEELKINVSGGSDFSGRVEVSKLAVHQSGGSDVKITGKTATLSVDASGGSDFNGYDLSAEVCDIEASGGSDIEVTASQALSARASGASDVRYKGTPTIKEAKASGASSVTSKS